MITVALGQSGSRGFSGSLRSSTASRCSIVSSGSQDRVAQVGEAVGQHPLDLADPDDHPGQLGRVGVELDAEHRLRADLRELHRHLQRQRRPQDRLALQVLERLQREVEEVARAAGRVEHAHGAQPLEEGVEDRERVLRCRRLCRDHLARSQQGLDLRAGGLEVAPQRGQQHRLDEAHDRGPVGVVRAELRALAGVEAALEERAEDRRLDLRPVEPGDAVDERDLLVGQRQHRGAVEEAAVEPLDALRAEEAALLGHLREQLVARPPVNTLGSSAACAAPADARSPAGSRPASSANMQNSSLSRKWATSCGSWPRARRRSASEANSLAASAVSSSRVLPGLNSSGCCMTARSSRNGSAGSARRRSRSNPWTIASACS